MRESERIKPPAEWLQQLSDAGHWDRLIQIASESLAIDPEDAETHRQIAWAYAKVGRLPAMAHHVAFLLSADPEDVRHHHLAAVYYLEIKLPKQAAPHIDTLLRLAPHSATYHYLAGIHALNTGKRALARTHLANARNLAPGWAPAAHLEIQIDAIDQTTASDAWDRIRRLEDALAFDPQNAGMLTSIGEIYLEELERPREAGNFFRRALCIDPTDHHRQTLLLKALRAGSILYRTLSIPAAAAAWARELLQRNPLYYIYLIIAFKVVAAFIAWLILVGALFIPSAKVYEWFVLDEIPRTKPFPRAFAWMTAVRSWPLWVRMLACLAIIFGGWIGLLAAFGLHWTITLQIIAWTFGVHLLLISLLVGIRHLRARYGLWSHQRRMRKQTTQKFEARA